MLTTNQILAKIEQHKETIKQFGVQKLTINYLGILNYYKKLFLSE